MISRTKRVINKLLEETYPSSQWPREELNESRRKPLKSFTEVTGERKLGGRTKVLISPTLAQTANKLDLSDLNILKGQRATTVKQVKEANIDELSQKVLRSYMKKADRAMIQQITTDHIVDSGTQNPLSGHPKKDPTTAGRRRTKNTPEPNLGKFKNRQRGVFAATNRLVKMPKDLGETPTNAMGLSSSTHGTGDIDLYDMMLGTPKKRNRRKSK